MSYSPWGAIDHVQSITRGVATVDATSHGGLRVSKGYAVKHLTPAALSKGIVQGGYYFFEQDCRMSIPLFELPEVRKAINPDLTEDACLRSISLWDPDYLLKRGLTPVEPQYSQWCGFQAHNQMRADRHPDLIVSAMGQGDGTVRVWTADGAEHIVTKASYKVTTLNLLSKCDILSHVPPKVEPEPETKVLSRDEALHLFGR